MMYLFCDPILLVLMCLCGVSSGAVVCESGKLDWMSSFQKHCSIFALLSLV